MPTRRDVERIVRLVIPAFGLVVLASCGGGGASPAGGSGPGGASAPPAPPSWTQTSEYMRSYGLGAIGASAAYVGGWTGAGVRIAAVDTGIDTNNIEFKGAIDPASKNIAAGNTDIQDPFGHGTAVAGVIAAARNNVGTYGVAHDATLLVLRADTPGSCPTACSFTQANLASATNYATAHGARVINYSLGGAAPSAAFANALTAASSSAVLVAAAGNNGGADPVDPALSLALAGRGIAVGALDSNSQLASFSNRAGIARDYYLVAPGVGVVTTSIGGGLASWNGTSLSTPYVSGAAAILLQRFPFLTSSQVIDLLLRTATDLGAPGTDPIYGRGLLNLQAALAPQGPLSIPAGTVASAGGADLTATSARLGPAFGDALVNAPLLKQAIVLDAYGRPYGVDLSQQLRRTNPAIDMRGWLRPRTEARNVDIALNGGSVTLGFDEQRATSADLDSDPERSNRPFSLAANLPGGYRFGMGRAFGLDRLGFSNTIANTLSRSAFTSPFLAASESSESIAFGAPAGPLTLRFGLSRSNAELADSPAPATTIRVGEIGHRWDNGTTLKLQFGDMREQDGLLGSSGSGAYALSDTARTRFLGWFATLPLSESVELAGSYIAGLTGSAGADRGVLRDISSLRSEAFSLGIFNRRVLGNDDRLGFVVSQPLRIAQGSATIDVPVSRTMTGDIVHAAQRSTLAPSGRELDAEIEYRILFENEESLTVNLLFQSQPGHDVNASPAVFGGLRYRLQL